MSLNKARNEGKLRYKLMALSLTNIPLRDIGTPIESKKHNRDLGVTISDDALDPGEEALHPCVDAESGMGTTGPVAHHSDQDELAWRRKNLQGVDGVFIVVGHIWDLRLSFPPWTNIEHCVQ